MNIVDIPKFDGLSVSSKFGICGLPVRLDSYKTCSFGCAYCFANNRKVMEFEKTLKIADVNSIARRLKRVVTDKTYKKTHFLDVLIANGITWHCGGMSDPFQPVEAELGVTKSIVDVTNRYGISILFSTKSDSIYNVDARPDLHSFQLSVSNVHDRKDIEPNVPDIEKRYGFFQELKRRGFKVGVRIQPFIPSVSGIDIVRMFSEADHFTVEGMKLVPQNAEQKEYMLKTVGLTSAHFTQMGLLTLLPDIRARLYRPLIDYFERHHKSYSISDNDLRYIGNNDCCCGDALIHKSSGMDTTLMIKKHGRGGTSCAMSSRRSINLIAADVDVRSCSPPIVRRAERPSPIS